MASDYLLYHDTNSDLPLVQLPHDIILYVARDVPSIHISPIHLEQASIRSNKPLCYEALGYQTRDILLKSRTFELNSYSQVKLGHTYEACGISSRNPYNLGLDEAHFSLT